MNLKEILKSANIFVPKKSTMPVLQHISVNSRITATDLYTSYVCSNFYDRTLESGCYTPLQLENYAKNNIINKPECSLDEYPSINAETDTYKPVIVASVKELENQLSNAILYASKDISRYNDINGVCFDNRETTTKICGTDGHRAYSTDCCFKLDEHTFTQETAILPLDACKKLVKFLKLKPKNTFVNISFSKDFMQVYYYEDETIYIRLIDGVYPNIKQALEQYNPSFVEFPAKEFREFLESAKPYGKTTKDPVPITINISDKLLTLSTSSKSLGKLEKNIDINYAKLKINVAIQLKFLLEFVSTLDKSADSVNIHYSNGNSVIKLDQSSYFMPCHIQLNKGE